MNRKLLITKYQERTLSAVEENGRIVSFSIAEDEDGILGNIYIARVQKIVKNLQAAFLVFGEEKTGYYSLEDNPNHFFTNTKQNKKLCEGDSILVQVARENVKTKPPMLTSRISLTGKYVVLTVGNTRLSLSSKITDKAWRDQCKERFRKYCNDGYGWIIRTNAYGADFDRIEKEIQILVASYEKICDDSTHRTCYSCLYKSPPDFINQVKNIWQQGLEEVITDKQEYYSQIKDFFEKEQPEDIQKLRLYSDESWPLLKCYNIEKQLERALAERVWLKSGAYLVIQPTEALTVIDVNTGKCVGSKHTTSLKINLEAAEEIAVQLKLRNLSGIIIVDFISMEQEEDNEKLVLFLKELVQKDAVKTRIHGMTSLGLVEITRKKIKKPLYEQFYRGIG